MNLIRKANENLAKIAPTHNPFGGHLAKDPDTKSRFSFENAGIGTIADLLGQAELIDITEGRGAILLTFDCGWSGDCGEVVINAPIASNNYRMELVHGMLQARGDGQLTRQETKQFTICLTWEDVPGVGKDLALASVYPGKPDEPSNLDGLKEGDVLTGSQLLERNITRVC